jgi:hypothetical protein
MLELKTMFESTDFVAVDKVKGIMRDKLDIK